MSSRLYYITVRLSELKEIGQIIGLISAICNFYYIKLVNILDKHLKRKDGKGKMLIRIGSKDELKQLWGNSNSPTQTYFVDGIEKGNIEFWTIENEIDSSLVGELYIFWNSEDKDEANGNDRAYLCAFRINKEFQGSGLGKMLMQRVLLRVKEKGFSEATIGVDNDDVERLTCMYKSWGFSNLIKMQNIDYHYINKNNKPTYYEVPYALFLNKL